MTAFPRRLLLPLGLAFGLGAGLLESASQFIRHAWFEGTLPLGWFTLWMPALANAAVFLVVAMLLFAVHSALPRLLTTARVLGVYGFLAAMAALRVLDGPMGVLTVDLLALGLAVRLGSWGGARPGAIARHAWRAAGLLVAVVGALALAVGGGYRLAERRMLASLPAAPAGAPNVLLLVLDTVRRANVSAYGYERRTTPELEALADRGARFVRAISPSPWTFPSHASLFTGRWAHELQASWSTDLGDADPTLAEALTANGYRTAGFSANVSYAGRSVGLGRGFSYFEDVPVSVTQVLRSAAYTSWLSSRPWLKRRLAPFYKSYHRRSAAEINAGFLRWLDRGEPRPFFAFLNYFDAHDPYRPAPPFDTAFASPAYPPVPPARHGGTIVDDRPRSLREYDQAIATVDAEIGRLLRALEARGQRERTLVIVTADHGEEFGEHGLYGHGHTLNLQALDVGAIVVLPGTVPAGTRVAARVSLRDLPATVMDLAGVPAPTPFPGASLRRYWSGAPAGWDTLYVETRLARNRPEWDATSRGDLQGIFAEQRQAIRHADSVRELYDLATDSLQVTNLAGRPEHDLTLRQLLGVLDRVMGAPARAE